jgi:Zn-dependent M16 (insulinase) family peptidase
MSRWDVETELALGFLNCLLLGKLASPLRKATVAPSFAQAFAAVNWVMTDEPLDVETELALGFLNYLLLGTPAAPLRKALNDSGLGASLIGGGMDDDLKQPVFSVGLKGVDPKDVDKVRSLSVVLAT